MFPMPTIGIGSEKAKDPLPNVYPETLTRRTYSVARVPWPNVVPAARVVRVS
jgi:hypothetical protein